MRGIPLRSLVVVALSLALCAPSRAQTSYPMITHTTPVAVQRGKTTEVTVEGQMNFLGVYKALFAGTGVSAEVVPAPEPNDAPGERTQVSSLNVNRANTADPPLGVR